MQTSIDLEQRVKVVVLAAVLHDVDEQLDDRGALLDVGMRHDLGRDPHTNAIEPRDLRLDTADLLARCIDAIDRVDALKGLELDQGQLLCQIRRIDARNIEAALAEIKDARALAGQQASRLLPPPERHTRERLASSTLARR